VGIERRCPSRVQQDVKRKDTQLALLNDDLIESQELVKQLEYNNTGLQGEIRTKDKIVQRERGGVDNMLCFIDKGADEEEHRYYVIKCQQKSLEMNKWWLKKRYPDGGAVSKWTSSKSLSITKTILVFLLFAGNVKICQLWLFS